MVKAKATGQRLVGRRGRGRGEGENDRVTEKVMGRMTD